MAGGEDQSASQELKFSPVWIGLVGVVAGAIVVTVYHLIAVCWCNQRRPPNTRQGPDDHQTNQEGGASSISNSMAQLIPIFRYSKEYCEEQTCAVCLCDFTEAEEVRVLPECLHLFHVACVDTWLNSHSSCPLCRADTIPPLNAVLSLPNPGGTPRAGASQIAGF